VRDLLLKRQNLDRDIVVEGDPGGLVRFLEKRWKGKVCAHDRFGTYVLHLPDGEHIDIATARTETYPGPAVLPVVCPGKLENDLFRRDFTMNALALPLSGSCAGRIIDLHGGLEDLGRGLLRTLHAKSFRDDPTRILRLARFAGRGFKIDRETARRIAKDRKHIRLLSDERVREELLAILAEKDPLPSLQFLQRWGVLKTAFPGIAPVKGIAAFRTIPERLNFLLKGLPEKKFSAFMEKMKFPRELSREVEALRYPPKPKAIIDGNDLIKMGYAPGPLFKKILDEVALRRFTSRKAARSYVFDKFPEKI
jgi:tRNA nucleotidyltransferase/poly(A) polymerase